MLSVGGVNYKIEGFFNLCAARGLTGKQGVVIPTSCISHLSLKPEVIEAVKAGQFQIWAVESVFESVEILLKMHFMRKIVEKNPTNLPCLTLFIKALSKAQITM